MDLGRLGIWSGLLRRDSSEVREAATELGELGFPTLWVPGGAGGDVFGDVTRLLEAAPGVNVATGILNIWAHDPTEVAAAHAELTAVYPGRFLLGIGVSHAPLVERLHQEYVKPLAKTRGFLDALDAAPTPVPHEELALAALGPKMLELARTRTAGSHPYFVTPAHTAVAREALGEGALLAPEQMIVLETDPDAARAVARQAMSIYLNLPNYTNNLLRTGFTEDDLAGGGSDRLVDGVVAWGDLDAIAARVQEHRDAGADHVCLQVLLPDSTLLPLAEWRRVAELLPG